MRIVHSRYRSDGYAGRQIGDRPVGRRKGIGKLASRKSCRNDLAVLGFFQNRSVVTDRDAFRVVHGNQCESGIGRNTPASRVVDIFG